MRVKDQAERAAVYKGFVRDALRHPNIVGGRLYDIHSGTKQLRPQLTPSH